LGSEGVPVSAIGAAAALDAAARADRAATVTTAPRMREANTLSNSFSGDDGDPC
jgi:hypothetical protein